ncbi:YdcF family protein [Brachybacterium vulturis]|uniref:YdcF family protein n=1 Tax=Brachybacterium vulturis TaxID=2017484 RepID=UPI0037365F46
MVGVGSAAALSWTAYLLLFRQDARRLRTGVVLLLATFSSISLMVQLFAGHLPTGAALLLVAGALGLIGTLFLGLTVVTGSLAVSPREGSLRGRLLSGLGGIALLLTPWVVGEAAASAGPAGIGAAATAGVIAMHLGLAYLVFLGTTVPYQWFPPRCEGTGIIILGSTLRDGEVPPLLRRRLDRAVAERDRLLGLGIDPLLVPSGGKGDGETPAEGAAMAAYLTSVAGVPPDRVRAETAARTTRENLLLSHRILDEAGHRGSYIISTSGYHAFRAALLARGLGYGDTAVGEPTAVSYLPTATLREYVLTMSYRKRWIAASLPVTAGLVILLLRAA